MDFRHIYSRLDAVKVFALALLFSKEGLGKI